jgi:hypothetical protein
MRATFLLLLLAMAGCATEPPLPTHAMPEIHPDSKPEPRQFRQFHSAPVSVEVNTPTLPDSMRDLGDVTRDFLIEQLTQAGVKVQPAADWKVQLEVTRFGHPSADFNGDNCISVVTRVVRPNQAFLAPDMHTDRCATNGQGMFATSGDDAKLPPAFPTLAKRLERMKPVKDEPALGPLYQTVMQDVLTKLDR